MVSGARTEASVAGRPGAVSCVAVRDHAAADQSRSGEGVL